MSNFLSHYGFEFSSRSSASPELSSAQRCLKFSLVVSNLLFLIFGCVLAAVGTWALNNPAGNLSGQTIPAGLIVLGVFILIISLLGCFAAFLESRFMLGLYFTILLLLTLCLFLVGIAVYTQRNDSIHYMVMGWNSAPMITKQDVQVYFSCCGLLAYNDTGLTYPGWMCPPVAVAAGGPPCIQPLQDAFQNGFSTAGQCAIVFAVLMLLGLALVCVLMSGIKQKRRLEEIQALHRKIREAKEGDPGVGGIRPYAYATKRRRQEQRDQQYGVDSLPDELRTSVEMGRNSAAAAAAGRQARENDEDSDENETALVDIDVQTRRTNRTREEEEEEEEEEQVRPKKNFGTAKGGRPPPAARSAREKPGQRKKPAEEEEEEEEEEEDEN